MGVSGCGKSTLARALADRLSTPFIEGDSLHPPANIAKMAAGIALDDADRQPFLEAVAEALRVAGPAAVASCSALKRCYRDLLRARAGDIVFVLPSVDRATLGVRLAARHDHFMPAALLDSQLATLELPAPDESVLVIDGSLPTAAQVDAVLTQLEDRPT
jgi:carbohydrate kinase (thermoresistant glucokinase family)